MTSDFESGISGQLFGDFLREQGLHEETHSVAIKRVIAWQLQEAMLAQNITKVEMARRLETSRAQLDRLLDPENDSVTLGVLARAARVLGRSIRLELT